MFRMQTCLWLGVALLPVPACAASLPPVDFVSLYLAERHETLGADGVAAQDDAAWRDRLLAGSHLPSHPYTEPAGYDASTLDDAFKRAAGRGSTPDRLLYWPLAWDMLQWDLGYTKARPDVLEIPVVPDWYGNPHAALNAIKAGVQPDIFHKALALFGPAHSTVAAKFAVAAQVLRDRVARTPEDARERRNVRADVLERFMSAMTLDDLPGSDLPYLRHLLETEYDTHSVGRSTFRATREIATPFRVARVAAAYRDSQGYVAAPCTAAFRYQPGVASLDPAQGPLCFVDAHDRAVYAWYSEAFRREAMGPEVEQRNPTLANALALLAPLGALLDVVAAVEFMESLAADDLALSGTLEEDEALAYERRAGSLTCRIP